LEYSIHDPLLLWTNAPTRKVRWNGLINLNDGGFFVDDMELVLVHQLVIASTKLANRLVMSVHDGCMAMPMAITRVMVAFETEQNVFTLPSGSLKIGGPNGVVPIAGPDQVTIITEDIWRGLPRAMHLSGFIWKTCERGDEQVPLLDISRGWDSDIQAWRREIRTRPELPICGS